MQLTRIATAFPATERGVLLAIAATLEQDGISGKDLGRMVDTVIRTHHYPTVTVADVVGALPTKVRLMTHWEAYTYAGAIPHPSIRKVATSEETGTLWAKVTDLLSAGYDDIVYGFNK